LKTKELYITSRFEKSAALIS